MSAELTITPAGPGLIAIHAPFNETLRRHLVAFGGRWRDRAWIIGEEFEDATCRIGEQLGFAPSKRNPRNSRCVQLFKHNERLHVYQRDAVDRLLVEGRLLVCFEMGLGKTCTAIEGLRLKRCESALVVCPAVVRQTWLDELARWWPNHPKAKAITTGKEAAAWDVKADPIAVTSYELFQKLPFAPVSAIVCDEAHYLMNRRAGRSTSVAEYAAMLPVSALRVLLTGTPIFNEVQNLHSQLDILYPGRYGTRWQFIHRYCKLVENPYAPNCPDIVGVNEKTVDELHERVGLVCARVTKKEVAGLLPPVIVSCHRVRPRRAFNVKTFVDKFTRIDAHRAKIDDCINAAAGEKIPVVCELVKDKLKSGATHILVYTHLRNTANEIAEQLEVALKDVTVVCVHGETTSSKRHTPLRQAAQAKLGVVVATMHAIGVGINELSQFTETIFAELDYTPGNIEQAAARTNRLSSGEPSNVTLVVLQGTQEEIVAERVRAKMEDSRKVLDPTQVSGGVATALAPLEESDTEFFKRIQEAARKMVKEDVYV